MLHPIASSLPETSEKQSDMPGQYTNPDSHCCRPSRRGGMKGSCVGEDVNAICGASVPLLVKLGKVGIPIGSTVGVLIVIVAGGNGDRIGVGSADRSAVGPTVGPAVKISLANIGLVVGNEIGLNVGTVVGDPNGGVSVPLLVKLCAVKTPVGSPVGVLVGIFAGNRGRIGVGPTGGPAVGRRVGPAVKISLARIGLIVGNGIVGNGIGLDVGTLVGDPDGFDVGLAAG
jgi:hypothetical protein